MKGIRKLFLGLVFTTLFCAGFKIEAKAVTPYLGVYKNPDYATATDFSDENAALVGYVEVNDDTDPDYPSDPYDFPNAYVSDDSAIGSVTYRYVYKAYNKDATVSPAPILKEGIIDFIYVRSKVGTDVVTSTKIQVDGEDKSKGTTIPYTITLFGEGREAIRTELDKEGRKSTTPAASVLGNYVLKLEPAQPTTEHPDYNPVIYGGDLNDTNVTLYNDISYDPAKTSASVPATVYRIYGGAYHNGTRLGDYQIVYDNDKKVLDEDGIYLFSGEKKKFSLSEPETSSKDPSYTFRNWTTDGATSIDKTEYELTADKSKELKAVYGKLELNITQANTVVKAGGDFSDGKDYKFTDYSSGTPSAIIEGVYIDNQKLDSSYYKWESGSFKFKVPSGTSDGVHNLRIVMKKIAGTTAEGEHIRKFQVDDGSAIDFDTQVYVTYNMTIPINKFITPEKSEKVISAQVSGDAASYARLRKSGTKTNVTSISNESAADILLVGYAVSGSNDKSQVKVTYGTSTQSAKVTVFPLPDLVLTNTSSGDSSLNSTSSSSSSTANSPFKVVMPAGDYHDNTAIPDIKKAKLIFETSGKTKEATLDINETGKYTRTANVNSMAVTSILNDLCTDSSHDVKITVYPMDGSDVDKDVKDTETITVYKITLDGSGGAKYTVNGTEMKDYFYAVKGTTYSIKSTSGNGEKFTKWEGDDFSSENGGTFTASGAKTFKAIYGGSSSSSSTGRNSGAAGDNLDDYDDVPKTGESKADIWILWSVLLISILGAGFMIYKRFGLVRAIAQADEEAAIAERIERAEAEKKEEENKLNMLKGLRNLK